MGISRRMFFGRSAAATAAAALVSPAAIASQGVPLAGLTALGGGALSQPCGAPIPSSPTPFYSFAKWWMECGEENARRQARNVQALDPDIIGFALPLQTKMRLQQERNYRRIREDRERDFAKEFARHGKFEWWL